MRVTTEIQDYWTDEQKDTACLQLQMFDAILLDSFGFPETNFDECKHFFEFMEGRVLYGKSV